MRLGAIHRAAPPSIAPLHARASLSLMTAPPSCDWHAKYPANGDALGNDTIGVCVEAAEFQTAAMRRANAWGDQRRPTADQVVALYTELSGFNPATGVPDDGTDTAQAMAAWCANGVYLDPQTCDVVRWATVDPANLEHVKLAIATTGPIQITLNLPLSAQETPNWALDPTPWLGQPDWKPGGWGPHRVGGGKYDGDTLEVLTWGKYVPVHPRWFSAYALGCDATISREFLDTTGIAPNGLDWSALENDIRLLATA